MSGIQLYEGKAKILFTTDDPLVLLSRFKDDATAFNALKKGTIANNPRGCHPLYQTSLSQ